MGLVEWMKRYSGKGDFMAAKIGSAIQLILALSIFYLGYTIHSMTTKVGQVIDTYPQIIEDISTLSENLRINEWLTVADTLEQLLPGAIQSIEGVTAAVNETNKTAASIDAKIPSIVEEVALYRQSLIPLVIGEAKQYRTTVIPKVLIESEGYRKETVPLVVKESQALRVEIPPMLAKADEIVDQSQKIAEQATSGAVKGVIMSPINLIKDAGTELKGKIILEEVSHPEQ